MRGRWDAKNNPRDYGIARNSGSGYGIEKPYLGPSISFSLPKLECGPQEINSREMRLHLPFSENWNKRSLRTADVFLEEEKQRPEIRLRFAG